MSVSVLVLVLRYIALNKVDYSYKEKLRENFQSNTDIFRQVFPMYILVSANISSWRWRINNCSLFLISSIPAQILVLLLTQSVFPLRVSETYSVFSLRVEKMGRVDKKRISHAH